MIALLFTLRIFWRTVRLSMRDPEFSALLTITSSLLALGTLFYHRVEGWEWLDSLYFCVITLTTVGYGDLTPQTDLGKVFTMIYLLLGIGLLVALITRLASALTTARQAMRAQRQQHAPKKGADDPA